MKKLILIFTSFFLLITFSVDAQTNTTASGEGNVEEPIPDNHKPEVGCWWFRDKKGKLFCKKVGPCRTCTPEWVDAIHWCKCNGGGFIQLMADQGIIMDYKELHVELSPNPASSEITVRLQSPVSGKLNIELFDINGNLLKESNSMMLKGHLSKKINLSANLDNGVYLVKVTVGEQSVTERIIVSK